MVPVGEQRGEITCVDCAIAIKVGGATEFLHFDADECAAEGAEVNVALCVFAEGPHLASALQLRGAIDHEWRFHRNSLQRLSNSSGNHADFFPRVLADICNPQLTADAIERAAPRIAQARRPTTIDARNSDPRKVWKKCLG